MIYKTFSYPPNPTFEYQFKNGNWYKKKKGLNEPYVVVDTNGQKTLNAYFKKKGFLFNYSTTTKIVGAVAIMVGGFFAYNYYKKMSLSSI